MWWRWREGFMPWRRRKGLGQLMQWARLLPWRRTMDGWQPQGWRLREGLMHGIESFLKGRDRIPIGNTFWKAPMLRGSSVLLPLIPCLSLCSLPCSGSRVGRSGPFIYSELFRYFQISSLDIEDKCNLHDASVRSAVKGGSYGK